MGLFNRSNEKSIYMRKKNFTSWGMAILFGCCLMFSGCSSEEEAALNSEGKGAVQFSLDAKMGFEAKTKAAVNEETYLTTRPLENYKVQILNSKGDVVPGCDWIYKDVPKELIELKSGSYKIVAFDGEDFNKTASTRDGIYMYGETDLTINSDQVAKKSVACAPACGKLVVIFGKDMEKYFTDYSVQFKTKAAGEGGSLTWAKTDADPLYVKIDKAGENVTASFTITTKDGKKPEVKALTALMRWGSMWTITLNPKVEDTTGKVGITITFDDKTNDKPLDIEIPSDWL